MRWLMLMAAVLGCGGCGSVEYQGLSPSFRWTRDEPGLRDVYYGADMNFARVEPAPYHSGTFAHAEPADAWNTPVAFQPLTAPEVRPVEEATVSREQAIGEDHGDGDDLNK